MPPSIELSPATFERLKAHAIPLVDTSDSAINRLIDRVEQLNGAPAVDGAAAGQSVQDFTPNPAPDLTHTKILSVSFCGKPLGHGQDTWNGLLFAAVGEAKARVDSPARFNELMLTNYVDGNKTDEGFLPVPGAGISVQRRDANGAWRAASHIAQKLGCQLSVTFAWRDKEGAARPGKTGRFVIPGK